MGNKSISPHLAKTLSINEQGKNEFIQQHNLINNDDHDNSFEDSSYQNNNGRKKHGSSPRFRRRHSRPIQFDKKGKKVQVK